MADGEVRQATEVDGSTLGAFVAQMDDHEAWRELRWLPGAAGQADVDDELLERWHACCQLVYCLGEQRGRLDQVQVPQALGKGCLRDGVAQGLLRLSLGWSSWITADASGLRRVVMASSLGGGREPG